ncbi:hypothetical protein ABN262_23430, partial [Citrobacter youngae]|uniref:hypothetical protein n=1 Tax=Citrobacter youngae TaxID=133448 RepID=UPI0032D9EFFE
IVPHLLTRLVAGVEGVLCKILPRFPFIPLLTMMIVDRLRQFVTLGFMICTCYLNRGLKKNY